MRIQSVRYLKLQKCAKFSIYYCKSLSKIARLGATTILTQIDPNLTQLTLGAMSNYSPIKKLIAQLCPNRGTSNQKVSFSLLECC